MIDIHTHLHPPQLAKAIVQWFRDKAHLEMKHDTEPEAVAQALRSQGIERFVFCSYAHKTGMARSLNTWLVETAERLNRYGLPLATVYPDDPDFVDYYRNALRSGCIGLKIHEDVQRFAIDDPRLEPVHALTEEHHGFVLVHVGPIPWSRDTNNGPLRIAQVMDKHPNLKIVVAHLGVPDTLAYLELTRKHPNLYIDTTMGMTTEFPLPGAATRALFTEYANNILFGSDYPIMHFPYVTEPTLIRELKLEEEVEQKIFRENAKRLLAPHL